MAKVPAPPRPPQEAFPTERGSPCPPDMSHSSNLSGRPVAFSEDGRLPMAHRGQAVARPWRPPISSTPPGPALPNSGGIRQRGASPPHPAPTAPSPPTYCIISSSTRRESPAAGSGAIVKSPAKRLPSLPLHSLLPFIHWVRWMESPSPPGRGGAPPQKKQNAPLFPTPPTCRFLPSDFPLPPPVQGKIRGTRLSYGIFVPSPPLPPGNPLVRPCPASTPTWKASPGKRSWN